MKLNRLCSFRAVVFDLDGTLVDTLGDICTAANILRQQYALPVLSASEIMRCIGNGPAKLVERVLPAGCPDLDAAIQLYKDLYRKHQTDTVRLYDGVGEGLEILHQAGTPMAVLTNKPEAASLAILSHLGVKRFFTHIAGAGGLYALKPDPEGILAIIHEWGLMPAEVLMAGDSDVDVDTAYNAAAVSVYFEWGYGKPGLRKPAYSISAFSELVRIVQSGA
jgi:phosphoglycolate phosphatase